MGDSRDELWAADRNRVGVCLGVTPKFGVSYEDARAAVFSRVDWPERELRWIDARKAPCDDAPEGWIVECTCSCLAHGDEVQVAYRIEGLAADVVEEADVIVSAPCHIPLLELTLDDVAFDPDTGLASPLTPTRHPEPPPKSSATPVSPPRPVRLTLRTSPAPSSPPTAAWRPPRLRRRGITPT